MKNTAVLLLSTPIPLARKGAVAAITQVLVTHNGSILHADDHVDSGRGMFLSRLEWDLDGFDIPVSDFQEYFKTLAEQYKIKYHLAPSDYRPKVVILVSLHDHCLADLLYRHSAGELACDVLMIIGKPRQGPARLLWNPFPSTDQSARQARIGTRDDGINRA